MVAKGENLFPRVDVEQALAELEKAEQATQSSGEPAVEVEPQLTQPVDFDTFCRSDFRAVKVKDCQRVKKSEKLLCFTLDDGTGTDRQILSGIAKYYQPEQLVGKTLVAIVNLPPPEDDGPGVQRDAHLRGAHPGGGGATEPDHGGRRHPRRRQAVLRRPWAESVGI